MNTENQNRSQEASPAKELVGVDVPRLVRLEAGCWVRTDTITAILVHKSERGYSGTLHRARCCVHHGQSNIHVLLANDDQHAVALADGIAAQVNSEPNAQILPQ